MLNLLRGFIEQLRIHCVVWLTTIQWVATVLLLVCALRHLFFARSCCAREHHAGTALQSGVKLLVQSPTPLSARNCFKSIAPLVTAWKEAADADRACIPQG